MKTGILPKYLLNKTVQMSQIHNHDTRQRDKFCLRGVSKSASINSLFLKGLRLFKIFVMNVQHFISAKQVEK
ncbi:hypothetical protein WA026_018619 [Henosepilachna vigintioctopunctata]|uniref:Uncharacterized protein n=1 Tax=Henosepilachna vigintioctopunctata TaxID=420089 RepID=A0AAW1U4W2_9CUCU